MVKIILKNDQIWMHVLTNDIKRGLASIYSIWEMYSMCIKYICFNVYIFILCIYRSVAGWKYNIANSADKYATIACENQTSTQTIHFNQNQQRYSDALNNNRTLSDA